MALASLLQSSGLQFLKDNASLQVLRLEGISSREVAFPHGESYRGGWRDGRVRAARRVVQLPAGLGRDARGETA